jgi:transposase
MLRPAVPTVFAEFDQRVYDLVIPAEHYLRQVQLRIDFERFRSTLEQTYSVQLGRPPIDPIRMLKLQFLSFHYKLSDRVVLLRAQTDVAFRWFLGFRLEEQLPHPTSEVRFRTRIGAERFLEVFQAVVTQAREYGLVKDRLRLKDATHVLASAAEVTPLTLAAQVRQRLLAAATPLFAEWVADQHARIETLRQTTAEYSDEQRLAARIEYLREAATQLRTLGSNRPADDAEKPLRQRLDNALALVDKLLADHADPEAGDGLASAADADARWGWHGSFFLGFLLDVAMDADSGLITAVNALPGNGAEAADAVELIRQEEAAQGNDVAGMSIDGAGYNGPVLRELTDPEGLNLDVTVPPPEAAKRPTFGPERFELKVIADGVSELTCPGGQTTQSRASHKSGGYRYRFGEVQCRGCPLRGECLENPSGTKGRTVIKNEYDAEYRRVQAKAATAEYEQTRRVHPRIERKLGELARHHDNRRARYRGLIKVLLQCVLTAVVVNVKLMVKLLGQQLESPDATLPVRADLSAT